MAEEVKKRLVNSNLAHSSATVMSEKKKTIAPLPAYTKSDDKPSEYTD